MSWTRLADYMLSNKDLRSQNTFAEAKEFAEKSNNVKAVHFNKAVEIRFLMNAEKYKEGIELFEEIKKEAIRLRYVDGYYKAYKTMSRYYSTTVRIDSITFRFLNNELITSSQLKDENIRGRVMRDYGFTHYMSGRMNEAGKYFEIAANLFKKTNNKTDEAGATMNAGITYYQSGDFYKSIPYYERAEKVFAELKDSFNLAKVYENYAISYARTPERSKTETYYLKALDIYKKQKDTTLMGGTYDNMGSFYEKIDQKDKAVRYYFLGLKHREMMKDTTGVISSYHNISTVYSNLKNYNEAFKYLNNAMQLSIIIRNKKYIALTHQIIGHTYFDKKENEKALAEYQKAKVIYEELKSTNRLIILSNSIGNALLRLKRFPEAIMHYEKYLNAMLQYGDSTNIAGAYSNIGVCYYDMKNYTKALDYYRQAYEIRKRNISPSDLSDTYITFSNVYSQLKDYKNAYYFLYKSSGLKDSVSSDDLNKQLSEMQAKYDNETKEAQIKLLEKDKKLADEDIRRRKTQRNILLGGISILLLLLGLIFYGYKEKKKSNKQLADQKLIIEEKQKEILDSIHYAKRIQNAMLSGDFNWSDISAEHFILFKPRDIVSGDFYWSYYHHPYAVWCVADCTGHGVPGAFMSMIGVAYLSQIIAEGGEFDPGKVLNKLREKIIRAMEQKGINVQQRDGMDISLCVWDKNNNELKYAGANNAIYILRGSLLNELKPDKMPIGAYTEELKPFTTQTFALQKGDRIINFSDGYADQFGGEKGKKFMYKNLKNILTGSVNMTMQQQKELLEDQFNAWKGSFEQVDDVCMIGVEVV